MGLDGVELVMAWEERFGIAIPDRAAEEMLTPHAAIDYIYAQVGRPVAPICLTQRTFYRLRQAFASALGPMAPALTPRTSLSDLLTWETRTLVWAHLEAASGLQAWPALERPTWLARLIGLISLGVPALLVFTQQVPIAWAALLAVALLGLTLDGTRFAARAVPAGALTGGELARYLAGANAEALLPPPTRWTRDQVRDVVRATIVEQLGVRSDFSDDAHFVRDLGVS